MATPSCSGQSVPEKLTRCPRFGVRSLSLSVIAGRTITSTAGLSALPERAWKRVLAVGFTPSAQSPVALVVAFPAFANPSIGNGSWRTVTFLASNFPPASLPESVTLPPNFTVAALALMLSVCGAGAPCADGATRAASAAAEMTRVRFMLVATHEPGRGSPVMRHLDCEPMAVEPRAMTDAERWFRERFERTPERDAPFTTLSGEPVAPLYTHEDVGPLEAIGFPGEYPFTRGVYPSMYRGRLWTMRQFAGFGTAEETNERFRYLLDHGQTGLSTAFDMPSLMGHDSDHVRSEGEVGREGVAIDTLDDMETLFSGIDMGEVSTSMTINAPAAVMLAFYVVAAERQGIGPERLAGTIQTDILKEYIAQKEWCFPVDPAMRLVTDMIEFCARRMPRWHPVSISGYHIREAGSTAQQELAFTLKDGFTYVELAIERGLDVDEFAPRLSFFFNAHIDFFEEIAKYRAARRIWARELRDTYGARDERSLLMRFHTQTAGVSLTAQQPLNNIVRTATEALSAVLGGTQSLHTNSYDEALALPSEEAVHVALRTQQVIAHETGVTNTIDPLGGSYFVEALTDRMEEAAYVEFSKIDELGGMVEAIKQSYPQREIAEASFRLQEEIERGERVIVGVNRYQQEDERQLEILRIPAELERKQIGRVQSVRAAREGAAVETALAELRDAAAGDRNLMEPLLECARAHASEGEIVQSLQQVFGTYTETPVF